MNVLVSENLNAHLANTTNWHDDVYELYKLRIHVLSRTDRQDLVHVQDVGAFIKLKVGPAIEVGTTFS
jgi:hypothetical protein